MKVSMLVLAALISFSAHAFIGGLFADFKPGECAKSSEDGFIWKISRIEGMKYIAQGWFNKWGNEVEFEFGIISKERGFVKVSCPEYQIMPENDQPSCGKKALMAWEEANGKPQSREQKINALKFVDKVCPPQ